MTDYSPEVFNSELDKPQARFLSKVLQHTLEDGWKSAADFMECFPASDLITALQDVDALRVRLLVAATGVHEKIALKKSSASAIEDLELALEEKMVTPTELLAEFSADDQVRYLPAHALWEFAAGADFADKLSSSGERGRSVERISFLLETAIQEELLKTADITEGIGFDALVQSLPAEVLQTLAVRAFEAGRLGKPLDEELLLGITPLPELVGHLTLTDLWDQVVLEKIADPADFLDGPSAAKERRARPSAPPAPSTSVVPAARVSSLPPALPDPLPTASAVATSNGASTHGAVAPKGRYSTPPPPPPHSKSVPPPPKAKKESKVGNKPSSALPAPPRTDTASATPEDEETVRAVTEELKRIQRLPPNFAELPLAVLCSIESMYAELYSAEDDEERAEAIRDAFPNDLMLRSAMLGLIQLLDPTVDVKDPVIQNADPDSLVKIVLFEEKRRRTARTADAFPPEAPETVTDIGDAEIELELSN